jgi:hypothetical protein
MKFLPSIEMGITTSERASARPPETQQLYPFKIDYQSEYTTLDNKNKFGKKYANHYIFKLLNQLFQKSVISRRIIQRET